MADINLNPQAEDQTESMISIVALRKNLAEKLNQTHYTNQVIDVGNHGKYWASLVGKKGRDAVAQTAKSEQTPLKKEAFFKAVSQIGELLENRNTPLSVKDAFDMLLEASESPEESTLPTKAA